MASRLYRTTRPLYLQVTRALDRLGIAAIGSPTTVALVALYVTGLILLDARPTRRASARLLPGRCHDALNRLLRTVPLSTRALLGRRSWRSRSASVGRWARRATCGGRRGAREGLRQAAALGRMDLLVRQEAQGLRHAISCCVSWCSDPTAAGGSRSRFGCGGPSGPARQAPTRPSCSWPRSMLTELVAARLPFQLSGRGHPLHRRLVYPPGRSARDLLGRDPATQDHGHLARPPPAGRRAGRAAAAGRGGHGWGCARPRVTVYAPTYGPLRLVVTQKRHGNFEYRWSPATWAPT